MSNVHPPSRGPDPEQFAGIDEDALKRELGVGGVVIGYHDNTWFLVAQSTSESNVVTRVWVPLTEASSKSLAAALLEVATRLRSH